MTSIPASLRRSVLLLSLATFCSMAAQRICDAMLPELSSLFSASLAQTAQVVSLFAVAYGLAQLFYGPLGDRFGKFRIVVYATLACSVGSLASALAPSLNALVLARVAVALCAAAIIPLTMAWIGDVVDYARRQETLAQIGLGTTLGIVGGQLLGGLMADTLGWRWAFVLLAVLFGMVGTLLHADWQRQRRVSPSLESRTAAPPAFVAQAWSILTAPWSRYVLLIALVEGAAGFGVLAMIASHLHGELGLSLSLSGAVVALFGLGGVLYMALARHLIRRLGEAGLAQVGGALVGVSFLVLGFTRWWPITPLACLLAGFGFFMFHNTMQTNATQMAPTARGTGVSLFASALFLGQALGVLLGARLSVQMGSGAVIALGGGTIAALGLLLAVGLRRQARLTPG